MRIIVCSSPYISDLVEALVHRKTVETTTSKQQSFGYFGGLDGVIRAGFRPPTALRGDRGQQHHLTTHRYQLTDASCIGLQRSSCVFERRGGRRSQLTYAARHTAQLLSANARADGAENTTTGRDCRGLPIGGRAEAASSFTIMH